jgi:hypothetical protein
MFFVLNLTLRKLKAVKLANISMCYTTLNNMSTI